MKVQMNVQPHRGYSSDQVTENSMTLADLLAKVEEAIEEFGEDATVFTFDASNRYGASYGGFDTWGTLFEGEKEHDVCKECGTELDDEGECKFNHEDEDQ